MFKKFHISLVAIFATFTFASAQVERTMYPSVQGCQEGYSYYDETGKLAATYKMTVQDIEGNTKNGQVIMLYNFLDASGKPYFNGDNSFIMTVSKVDGQTYTKMDQLGKTLKVQALLPVGDASSLPVELTVGQTLPDSKILASLGSMKATITISGKKVIDHKTIKTPAGSFDCWLIHEVVNTKSPFSNDTKIADTWYSEGCSIVSQTVKNEKGKLIGTLELTSYKK